LTHLVWLVAVVLIEGTLGSVRVVLVDVVDNETFELVLVPDDVAVEELADGCYPAFSERVGDLGPDG
jgi:hypothetical protein